MNRFDNIDCMIGMKEYGDNHFDLAIVDPPYGIGDFNQPGGVAVSSKEKHKPIGWNKTIPTKEYFNELFRIAKNHIIFGCQYYTKYLRDEDCGRIIHDKVVPMGTLSQADIASCNMQKRVSLYRYEWNGMLQQNMKNKQEKIHPCEKPIALYKWLLTKYAKQGDLILDTHVGSASSLIACEDMGFEYVGFELDEEYYNAAQKRLKQFRSQFKLELKHA